MMSAWTVGINLVSRSNFGMVAAGIGRQAQTAEGHVSRLGTTMNRSLSVARVGFNVLGVSAAAAMYAGIRGAANLQMSLIGIKNATGANAKQMDMLREKAFQISNVTAQSVSNSADIMRVMARASAGVFTPEQLAQVALPAAKFADVQFLSRGVSFETGATWAIQLAHLFRQYDPKGVDSLFDKMTRLSEMMPHDLGTALRQMTYYMPAFKALHVSDDSSIASMALLDRFGFGRGKGGTNIADLVLQALGPLQMTKHMQVAKKDLLVQMGVVDASGKSKFFNKKSDSFDLIGFLRQLSIYGNDKNPHTGAPTRSAAELVKEFVSVFGKQGSRVGLMAADPKFLTQLTNITHFLGRKDLGLNQQQANYMNTLNGQFQRARTNLQSLLTDTMWGSLVPLTHDFRALADSLSSMQGWVHAHRDETGRIIKGMVAIALAAFVSLGVSAFRMFASVSGATPAVNRLAVAVAELGTASGIAGPRVGAAGGAIGAAGGAAGAAGKTLGFLKGTLLSIALLYATYQGVIVAVSSLVKRDKAHGDKYGYPDKVPAGFLRSGRDSGWGGGIPLKPTASLPSFLKGHADGGLTRGTGLGLLHPNEVIVRAPIVRNMEQFFAGSGGGGRNISVVFNYTPAAGEDDATSQRRAYQYHKAAAAAIYKLGANASSMAGVLSGSEIAMLGTPTVAVTGSPS